MKRSFFSFFGKRKKYKSLGLAQNQIVKSIETVSELEKSINAYYNNNIEEAEKAIEKLFQEEIEIDELRREVFAELAKETLPPEYREDLRGLVGRLDRMADFVKDAARSVKVLIDSKSKIPKEIFQVNVDMVKALVECTVFLSTSIEMLAVNPIQAKEFARKVDDAEQRIDEYLLKSKIIFIENAESVKAPTFMVLKDLVESMEQAADMCADTADYIRALASTEE